MSAATLADATTDAAVWTELWISFVSLTRSHLAAMQILDKFCQATLSQASANSLCILNLSTALMLTIEPESGSGDYQIHSGSETQEQGRWRLNLDATVSLSDQPAEDMELAVEALVRKLGKAGYGREAR